MPVQSRRCVRAAGAAQRGEHAHREGGGSERSNHVDDFVHDPNGGPGAHWRVVAGHCAEAVAVPRP